MESIICLYKPIGMTPLECVNEFREKHQEHKGIRMGYAGRLDPMAEGLLLVLVGEENKKRQKYLGLDKEYECEVLLGFATDTYDLLGKVVKVEEVGKVDEEEVVRVLNSFKGKQRQQFPAYSARTVQGKRLYKWAREGRLDEIEIPQKEIEIYSIILLSITNISSKELLKNIKEHIVKVSGNFRQEEIIKLWEKTLGNDNKEYPIIKVSISCSSGTYIRSIANELGKKIHSRAIALSIKRTKVGAFTLADYDLRE